MISRKIFFDVRTIVWRDWTVLRRRLKKFILSRLVTPVLYLVAFGWGLGRSIVTGGGTYMDFLVPGIIALNTMNVSYMSITTIHAEKVYHKSLEEYLSAPIEPTAYVVGKIFSAVFRAMISTAIILCVAAIFGANLFFLSDFRHAAEFFSAAILNSIIFAGVGFCAAMRVQSYEELAQVNTYILMPMSFLCGTFFSTSALPDAVRIFIEILPLTHASELLRMGFNSISMLVMIFYAALMIFFSFREFSKLTE